VPLTKSLFGVNIYFTKLLVDNNINV
jgi:hypothetical protein